MTPGMTDSNSQKPLQTPLDEPDTTPAAPALEDGYCVKFYVYGDGSYGLGEPSPLSAEEAEESDEADEYRIADLTSALKRLLNVVKNNPVGTDEEKHFDAGFYGDGGPKGANY